ncbi:MAG TPA: hypothetical protein VFA18_07390, partial [Gemmataceae bacterium]|nr:hypothetical protein [Gemmataceae bacterium]
MAGRFRSCHALWPFVLLGTALVLCAPASAGPYPHVRLQEAGDVQPITLSADSINTWQQGDVTILLLRGAVSIEHDMFRAGMDGGVVWIDRRESGKTGILHAQIFADGNVKMDNTAAHQTAARAFIDIYTRGEPHFQAKKSGIHEGALTNDALYRTAVAERQADTTPPGAVRQASAQDPAPIATGVPSNTNPMAASASVTAGTAAPPTTVVTAQPVPSGNGPLPPTIVPVPIPPATSPPPTLQPQPQPPAPSPTPPPGTVTPTVPPTIPVTPPRPAPPPLRQIQIVPRNGSYQQRTEVLPNGEQ